MRTGRYSNTYFFVDRIVLLAKDVHCNGCFEVKNNTTGTMVVCGSASIVDGKEEVDQVSIERNSKTDPQNSSIKT